MNEILKEFEALIGRMEKAIAIEAPDDYQFRFKENLREASNAVYRMKKAYKEFSLFADYQKR